MNENQNYNNGNVTPYRASGNLNTMIANPNVNINDPMNVNIQSMTTNSVNSNQNYDTQQYINSNNMTMVNEPLNNVNANSINNQNNSQSSTTVNRTYVTSDNKPKKKTIKLNLGPEFKIALLIVVILLVFVFMLPMISDIFNGY